MGPWWRIKNDVIPPVVITAWAVATVVGGCALYDLLLAWISQ